jgi:TonB-dependent starch-binding outer membrane protein SusC
MKKVNIQFLRKYLHLWVGSFILLLFTFTSALAQKNISGKVTLADGEGLPGVGIIVKGTTTGTLTDIEGKFEIKNVNDEDILTFSFVGYMTIEQVVGSQTTFSIVMTEDIKALEEIVVIGYGSQDKRVFAGSVASVSAQEITQTPILRVEQALQGRVTGVQVTNSSGQPGDAPTIRIRGAGTVRDASPLYVVDGMLVGGIDYLNPSDIESIDVLKDAASTAIYGVRGGNGVVLITTKSGKAGKTQVSYEGYVGVQNPWRKVNMLNAQEYVLLQNEMHSASGLTSPFGNHTDYSEGTDWQDEIFSKNAPIANHQLSISGGNEKSTFAATMGYFTQEGIIGGEKSKFDRYTARFNSNHKISQKFTFGENISYTRIDRRSLESNSEFNGLLVGALNIDPITPVFETNPTELENYHTDAVRDGNGNVYGISKYATQEIVNPLANLEINNGKYKLDKLVGNIYGEYEFIKGLKFRTSFGVDLAYGTSRNYVPAFYLNAARNDDTSRVSKSVDNWVNVLWENTLTYTKKFGEHNVTGLVGTSVQQNKYENLGGGKRFVIFDDFDNAYIDAATYEKDQSVYGGASESAFLSFFGRVLYDFKGKYMFTFTIRRDGSSRFGPDNKYVTLPSFSAGWVVSDETFMQGFTFIDFLKVRASWGQNGNASSGDYEWISPLFSGAGYTFGDGNFTPGTAALSISNAGLRWEKAEQTNVGLDAHFLNDQLSLSLDYYIKTNKDLLFNPTPLAVSGSLNAPIANAGEVQNKGVELALNYRNEIKGFNYYVGVNFSYNKNEFTKITNGSDFILGSSFSTYGNVSRAAVGFPIAYFYGYKTAGLFQNQEQVDAYVGTDGGKIQPNAQPGDIKFLDLNNDGVIDDKDRTMIGNPTPDWTYGITLGGDYKGFDLNIFLQGAIGNEIFNGIRRHDLTSSNMPAYFLNRWTGEGTSNDIPRLSINDPNGNFSKISDFYIENGSYLRLKDVQLGYSLPKSILDKIRIQRFRIYVAANNLLTFTKYRGFDPEIGAKSALDIAIDRGVYPQARSYRMGVNITF